MSKIKELIINALNFYDTNNSKNVSLFDKVKFYKINHVDYYHIISFFDKDKTKLFSSKYEVLGMYDENTKLWVWGWSIPAFSQDSITLSRKVLNYGFSLTHNESPFLKFELITSRFKVSDTTQLDIHVALAAYIAKNKYIYKIRGLPIGIDENGFVPRRDIGDDVVYYLYLIDIE